MKRWSWIPVAGCLLTTSAVIKGQELGAVFEDPEVYRDIPLALPPLRGELPEKVDLSSSFPRPGDQGKQGSCVGWATAYAMKTYLEKMERKWPGNRSQEQFSPAYIYNQIKLPAGGAHITTALDLMMRQGVSTLAAFPYRVNDDSRQPSGEVRKGAREFAIASWRRVNPKDISDMKSHLASGFPVLIGMKVARSFQRHRGSGVYNLTSGEQDLGGHAMCVVGYSNQKRAFKIINSWGTNWGTGGYAWVSFDAFNKKVGEGYVVQDIVPNKPEVDEPDPRPDLDPVRPDSPWIFADSSRRKLNPAELRVRSAEQLWRARNEIYARHGYIFKSERGKAFTRKLGNNYTPRENSSDKVEARFNDIEHYNIALIISFEHNRPNPVGPLPKNPWIFSDSSARRLHPGEVRSLSKDQRWKARNEIFARNGYIFSSDRGKKFAKSMGRLYVPVSGDMDEIYKRLNKIERDNVHLIKSFE